jgi:hypothetical protein
MLQRVGPTGAQLRREIDAADPERLEEVGGLVGSAKTGERLERRQCAQELGLVVVVLIGSRRRVEPEAAQLLTSEAPGGLLQVGVGLQRQGRLYREHLE